MVAAWLVVSLCTAEAWTQTAGWGAVAQVSSGATLEVKTRAGGKVKGNFIEASPDTLSVADSSGKRTDISNGEILEVRVRSAKRTAAFAAILAGVGLAVGYVLGFGIGHATLAEGPTEYAGAAIGALGGAGVGAFIGSRGRTIYKAP
jgi:hypothetical protein